MIRSKDVSFSEASFLSRPGNTPSVIKPPAGCAWDLFPLDFFERNLYNECMKTFFRKYLRWHIAYLLVLFGILVTIVAIQSRGMALMARTASTAGQTQAEFLVSLGLLKADVVMLDGELNALTDCQNAEDSTIQIETHRSGIESVKAQIPEVLAGINGNPLLFTVEGGSSLSSDLTKAVKQYLSDAEQIVSDVQSQQSEDAREFLENSYLTDRSEVFDGIDALQQSVQSILDDTAYDLDTNWLAPLGKSFFLILLFLVLLVAGIGVSFGLWSLFL